MLQEGPVAAVLVALAAQLQLASISCTCPHHHCTGLAASRAVHACWKWLACIEHLSWQSVLTHTLHLAQVQAAQ